MFGAAVTVLTAAATRHIPGVKSAAVTLQADHVGEAVALTAAAVAVTVGGRRTAGGVTSQLVTNTL